jgi:hypothetical protein
MATGTATATVWGQPGYEPPPSKPKPPIYRRPWFVILGVIGVLVVVGALLGDPPAEESTTAQRSRPRHKLPPKKHGSLLR